MTIQFAEKCAWRAVYIYRANGAQLAHLGFDPKREGGPCVFGALHLAPRYIGRGSDLLNPRVRITLPHVRWSLAARSPLALRVYRVQQRLLHGLDGRYGWGSGK